jgi:hypothetical protein
LPLPKYFAFEKIKIVVNLVVSTAVTAQIGQGILTCLKNITLQVSSPKQRDVWNTSGASCLELDSIESLNLDRETISAIIASKQASIPVGTVIKLTYCLNLVHPKITDSLRPYFLLPVHLFTTDPVLLLDFSTAAEMGAGAYSASVSEVILYGRDTASSGLDAAIIAGGGYAETDVLENPFTLPGSITNNEQRIQLPTSGYLMSMLISQFQGGATFTEKDLSGSVAAGLRSIWQIKVQDQPVLKFTPEDIRNENDRTRPLNVAGLFNVFNDQISTITNAGLLGGSPPVWVTAKNTVSPISFGGALGPGMLTQDPSTFMLDFLSDESNEISELGSMFDLFTPGRANQRTEIVANFTTPASAAYSSQIRIVMRRMSSDARKFQSLSRKAA